MGLFIYKKKSHFIPNILAGVFKNLRFGNILIRVIFAYGYVKNIFHCPINYTAKITA